MLRLHLTTRWTFKKDEKAKADLEEDKLNPASHLLQRKPLRKGNLLSFIKGKEVIMPAPRTWENPGDSVLGTFIHNNRIMFPFLLPLLSEIMG